MSIVDTFYKAPLGDPTGKPREWWYTDEAKDFRCAEYIASFCFMRYKAGFGKDLAVAKDRADYDNGPEWPAIEWYSIELDEILWLRCDMPLWLHDYARAYPNRLNKAAQEVLKAMESML